MWTKEEVGKVIKESRLAAGFTQVEVAKAMGRPQSTISAWEMGRAQPDANTLFELFHFLGRSVNEAFGFEEKKSPSTDEAAPGEKQLVNLFRELNEEGRNKLVDYADDLVSSGKYIKSDPHKLGYEKYA